MNTRQRQDDPAGVVSRLREELNALEVRAALAEQRHRELLEAMEDLRAACSQAEGRAEEYLRQAAASDSALQERQARLAALDEERAHTRAELTELRAHLLRSTLDLGAAQAGLKFSEEVRADLQARLAALDEERTRIHSELAELKVRLLHASSELNATQASLKLSEEARADLQARLDAARGEAEQLGRALQEATAERRDWEAELSRLRRELEQARARHEAELAKVRGESEARRLEQQALLTRAQQEHEAEIARLRQQAGALEQTIAGLQAALRAQEAELLRLHRIVARARDYVELIERSERWRFGGMLTRLGGRLLRRKAKPDAVVQLLGLLPTRGSMASRPAPAVAPLPSVSSVLPPAAAPPRAETIAAPPSPPGPILRPLEQMPGSAAPPTMPDGVSADVVVCVHDALADARECLESLIARTDHGYPLIVVDDGSGPETASFLQGFAEQHEHVRLIRNQSALGYTCAANQGLRASHADWVVLLNSDTIVTTAWLARLLECGESDPETGIVSPLSNNATWQSVPKAVEDGAWAENPLPYWLSVEDMSALVAAMSERTFPLFPLLTGFCLAVRRTTIDKIGYFDEKKFPGGYGEETEYCLRAAAAGITSRVADHCYVFHKGSRSFTDEGRRELVGRHRAVLDSEYGRGALVRAEEQIQDDPSLDGLRRRLTEWMQEVGFSRGAARRLRVLYLLGQGHRASGGIHMIVDAASALRALGIDARVAITHESRDLLFETYPEETECFLGYRSAADLTKEAEDFDVLVITHFKTARLAQQVRSRARPQLIAHFVQGFDPWIALNEDKAEALESYSLIPGTVRFAMTQWLCDILRDQAGATVHRVEPGFHQELYSQPRGAPAKQVTIATMLRPGWSWRNPTGTLRAMRRVKQRFGPSVRIVAFGCDPDHRIMRLPEANFDFEIAGVCTRQQTARLLADSDIVVDCSEHQAYGLLGIEAMASGCATVLPRTGGAGVYAANGFNTLLVDTTSDEAVAEAVMRLAKEPELRQRLARNGRRTAGAISLRTFALSQYLLFLRHYSEQFGVQLAPEPRHDDAAAIDARLRTIRSERARPVRIPSRWQKPPHRTSSAQVVARAAALGEELTQWGASLPGVARSLQVAKQHAGRLGSSYRWRLGTALVRLYHRLTFRPMTEDSLSKLTAMIASAQSQLAQAKAAQARVTKWILAQGQAALASPESAARLQPTRTRDEIAAYSLSLQRTPVPASEARLVSIVIPNRNGARHLQGCLEAIAVNTRYPSYEIIVIDNDSSDDSVAILKEYTGILPLTIIENQRNSTFSEACNQGADLARGDLVLFLNNDTEMLPGWLCSMVSCYLAHPDAGAIGARLVYGVRPELPPSPDRPDLSLQHAGICYEIQKAFIRPKNYGAGADPLAAEFCEDRACAGVTAACMLIERGLFQKMGGFDEAYKFGYEDVDLCLKLFEAGKPTYYSAKAIGFHYESGTIRREPDAAVHLRRLSNTLLLRARWMTKLRRWMLEDRITGQAMFHRPPLHIVLAVTEARQEIGAGDFLTASELATEFRRLGYTVGYVSQQPDEDQWYEVPDDADVLVGLLDYYDLRRVKCANPDLITIAWIRNWTEQWLNRPWISAYSIFLASSRVSADMVEQRLHRKCGVMRLAANARRFRPSPQDPDLTCEACFTGSYWGHDREIVGNLQALGAGRDVRIYGYNWEQVPEVAPFARGPLRYERLNTLYNSAQIAIDDSNPQTKPYASVNSRVFDSLAAGTLVITNNELGSQEVFGGRLPTYDSPEELRAKLDWYREHPDERLALAAELAAVVRSGHTYAVRAREFRDSLLAHVAQPRICVKIGSPRWVEADQWGDFHMAAALKRRFELSGCPTSIQILPDWESGQDFWYDATLTLRGLSVYRPKAHQVNLVWHISHPDEAGPEELEGYDHVFVASESHAEQLAHILNTPVSALLQCTDPELFRLANPRADRFELLYVGNSRKVMRRAMADLLPTDHHLTVIGDMWEGLIDTSLVRASHYPNHHLRKLYGSCAILLNDHWDDMREKGFISNRIFDAAACEALVITDDVTGLDQVFHGSVVTYCDRDDLRQKISHYLDHPEQRRQLARSAAEVVRRSHTFSERADVLLEALRRLTPGVHFVSPETATWDEVAELSYRVRDEAYQALPHLECNICGWRRDPLDEPYPRTERLGNFSCPSCRSLDHVRATGYFLLRFCQLREKRVLDLNPAPGMQAYLEGLGARYVSLDSSSPDFEEQLEAMGRASFDYVICRSLLEERADDLALWETIMARLKPTGLAILHLPVEPRLPETIEFAEPDGRYPGRARRYGADAAARFGRFPEGKARLVRLEEAATPDYAERFGFRGTILWALLFGETELPLPFS